MGKWRGHVEPICGILRVFEKDQEFGEPYAWACTMRWLNHTTVELSGVDKSPEPSMWRAILQACRDTGAQKVVFYRKGVKKEHSLTKGEPCSESVSP